MSKTKTLPLSQGFFAVVELDFIPIGKYHAKRDGRGVYAVRNLRRGDGRRTQRYLHQDVLKLPFENPPEVDHIDGDGLNNLESNLRVASRSENKANGRKYRGIYSSQYKGVSFYPRSGKWMAQIVVKGRRTHLGYFLDEIQAARAYDVAAIESFGEFARVNFK